MFFILLILFKLYKDVEEILLKEVLIYTGDHIKVNKNFYKKTVELMSDWKFYLFQEIGINEFCEIASEEDVVDERELIKAFRSIDKNQNGFIEYREFMDIFGNVIINIW